MKVPVELAQWQFGYVTLFIIAAYMLFIAIEYIMKRFDIAKSNLLPEERFAILEKNITDIDALQLPGLENVDFSKATQAELLEFLIIAGRANIIVKMLLEGEEVTEEHVNAVIDQYSIYVYISSCVPDIINWEQLSQEDLCYFITGIGYDNVVVHKLLSSGKIAQNQIDFMLKDNTLTVH